MYMSLLSNVARSSREYASANNPRLKWLVVTSKPDMLYCAALGPVSIELNMYALADVRASAP